MPPAGAQAMQALGAGAPPAFKRGGRVQKGGAEGGLGRIQKSKVAARTNKCAPQNRKGGGTC